MNVIPPSQAWSMLSRHANDEFRLRSLPRRNEIMQRRRRMRQQQQHQHDDSGDANDDDDKTFIFIHRSAYANQNNNSSTTPQQQHPLHYTLLADISRHHITNDTIHHLLRYSASIFIKEQIRNLARGGGRRRRRKRRSGSRNSTDRRNTTTRYMFGNSSRWRHTNSDVDSSTVGFQDVSFSSSTVAGIVGSGSSSGGAGGGGVTFAQQEEQEDDYYYDASLSGTMREDEYYNNNVDEEEEEEDEEYDDEDGASSFWGSSMHLAYRVPTGRGSFMQDPTTTTAKNSEAEQYRHHPVNALEEIHETQSRIQHLSHAIRFGKKRSARFFGDVPLVDVLVVSGGGGGVVLSGMEFVYHTLINGSASSCRLSYVDPTSLVSSSTSESVQSMPFTSDASGRGGGGGGGGMKKAPSSSSNSISMSTLHSTAGEVINMVTTPFKSVVQRGSVGGDGGGIRSLSLSSSLSDGRGPTTSYASSSLFQSQQSGNSRKKWRQRKLKILTSSDPSAVHEALCDLEPATTLVITININPDWEEEYWEMTSIVKTWLFSGMASLSFASSTSSPSDDEKRRGHILRHHMYSVNAPRSSSSSSSSSDQNVFVLPRHSMCEAFSMFSSAGLLPLSIIFGWGIVSSLLAGAHDIDLHFVDSSPRHNLPLMLAMVEFWNDAFLNSNGRVVSTCLDAMELYPRFVAVLESKVLNNASSISSTKLDSEGRGTERKKGPSPVIDGGSHTMKKYGIGHCMDKQLYAEFIMTFDSPSSAALPGACLVSLENAHQQRICTLLASVDLLAFGYSENGGSTKSATIHATSGFDFIPSSPPMIQSVNSMLSQTSVNGLLLGDSPSTLLGGNQPSTLLFCERCDAYTCGQLIALAEHRATVKAWLWDIDPFVITKYSIRKERHEHLSEIMRQMHHVLSYGENCRETEGSTSLFDGSMHSTTKFVLRECADRRPQH